MNAYTVEQRKTIEENGFRFRSDNKIIDNDGHLVPQSQVDHILNGSIVSNFDMAQLRKAKARKAATGSADLVASLREIAPSIEVLKVGQTAKIAMPKTSPNGKDPTRQFVMSIVTKLNNLTAAGREWAGRKFDSLSDDSKSFFYVTRLPDGEAKERKSGGRTKSNKADERLAAAIAGADNPEPNTVVDTTAADNQTAGEEAPKNHVMEEEAVIVKH